MPKVITDINIDDIPESHLIKFFREGNAVADALKGGSVMDEITVIGCTTEDPQTRRLAMILRAVILEVERREDYETEQRETSG